MYLHIGGNQMIDVHRIVAIFKTHPRKAGKSNPLQQYYQPLRVIESECKNRAYVVTEECIYATPLSLETLVKRYHDMFSKNH